MTSTVYKYRGWKKDSHKSVLLHGELYLTSPSKFNDPFDCRIPANFTLLNDEEIDVYAEQLVARSGKPSPNSKLIAEQIKKDREGHQAMFEKVSFKKYDDHLGVISMSLIWDSILMWSHYAEDHTGYCIGFNVDLLNEQYDFGSSGKVQYSENGDYPLIHPLSDGNPESFFSNVYSKAHEWSYEKEYRFAKISRPKKFKEEDRKLRFPKDCISEVMLGMNAGLEMESEIVAYCLEADIPVYKVKKQQFRFGLDRDKIT